MDRNTVKILLAGILAFAGIGVQAQTAYPLFAPANGVLKGDVNSYITTTAASSDITSLWSGTCDITTFLRGNGACALVSLTSNISGLLPAANGGLGFSTVTDDTIPIANGTLWQSKAVPGCLDTAGNHLNYDTSTNTLSCGNTGPAGTSGANPTGTIGLTAVNGVATTFLRSDGAPPLSQAISPTWSGNHTFSNAVQVNGDHIGIANTDNYYELRETDQGADGKMWWTRGTGGSWFVQTRTDAGGAGQDAFNFSRSGTTIGTMNFGNATGNPAFTFLGTGLTSLGGGLTVAGAAGITVANSDPSIIVSDTAQGADAKRWMINANGTLDFYALLDGGGSAFNPALRFSRSGEAITSIQVGNSVNLPAINFLGTTTFTRASGTPNSVWTDGTVTTRYYSSGGSTIANFGVNTNHPLNILQNDTARLTFAASGGASVFSTQLNVSSGSSQYMLLDAGTAGASYVTLNTSGSAIGYIGSGTAVTGSAGGTGFGGINRVQLATGASASTTRIDIDNTNITMSLPVIASSSLSVTGAVALGSGSAAVVATPSGGGFSLRGTQNNTTSNNSFVSLQQTAGVENGFVGYGSSGGLLHVANNISGANVRIHATSGAVQFTEDAGTNVYSVGFRTVPQNAQTANYTAVAADSGKHLYHASGAGAGDTYTIPANSSVAYDIGTVLTFVNSDSNAVSIAITTDTLTLGGTTTTGTRTLAQNGVATAIKVTSTSWIITGTGLT